MKKKKLKKRISRLEQKLEKFEASVNSAVITLVERLNKLEQARRG